MHSPEYDLHIQRGLTFEKVITRLHRDTRQPVDHAGMVARMHVREHKNAPTTLIEFSSISPLPANTEGRISLGNSDGVITLYLGATITEAITWTKGVYDLELARELDPDDVVQLLHGKVTVSGQVTR